MKGVPAVHPSCDWLAHGNGRRDQSVASPDHRAWRFIPAAPAPFGRLLAGALLGGALHQVSFTAAEGEPGLNASGDPPAGPTPQQAA
jgi:hypothetical protein